MEHEGGAYRLQCRVLCLVRQHRVQARHILL